MNRTDEIGELIKALCLAKKSFKPITKDGKNPFLNSKYVTLDGIVNATEDALNANGLVIIHHHEFTVDDTLLVTELIHESGQIIGTETGMTQYIGPVSVNEKGNVKVNPLQVFGSVITYLKRYHISELLNVAVDEDSDGADTAEKKQAKPPTNINPLDALNKKYFAMLAPKKFDEQARHDWQVANVGKASTNDWDIADYQKAIDILEAKPPSTTIPAPLKGLDLINQKANISKEGRFQIFKKAVDLIDSVDLLDRWISMNAEKITKSDNKDRINEYLLVRQHEIEELAKLGNGDLDANNEPKEDSGF